VPRPIGAPFDLEALVLQRKLIFNLGPLVIVLIVTGVTAILMLQSVLRGLDHVNQHGEQALTAADPALHQHVHAEQQAVMRQFRWIVVGLGLTFVLVINLSIIILLRMGWMVLRPVNKLLDATRELSAEHFDHRVKLEENDEFDALANAYNTLAEHLQQTEKRRMEVLGQVALTLNHELNNAMAAIELQLGLLGRRAGEDPTNERRLRTIHNGLARMKDTVQSLKSVRRIVLTDYADGMKMLDLVQSIGEPQPAHEATPT
jgi:nitrogen fixation/metabolism regulation signal transduction histidine kinase